MKWEVKRIEVWSFSWNRLEIGNKIGINSWMLPMAVMLILKQRNTLISKIDQESRDFNIILYILFYFIIHLYLIHIYCLRS